jgi:hypothetical protein
MPQRVEERRGALLRNLATIWFYGLALFNVLVAVCAWSDLPTRWHSIECMFLCAILAEAHDLHNEKGK